MPKEPILAPMAGVNDPVFRALCRRMGAGLTLTEMISSKGLAYGNKKTHEMLGALPEDKPYAVQLFGNEPSVMAAQAYELEQQRGSEIASIDLNMGCPAPKVVSQGSGAALLQQLRLAKELVAKVSSAVTLPITVKMRLVSSHPDALDTLAFAQALEEEGAKALALHGRTAAQSYTGRARREVITLLAQHLSIPVVASGDVYTSEDIDDYLKKGAATVMVARGAQGNPWIFARVQPSLAEIQKVAREHTKQLYQFEPHKLLWMRKHLAWYFKGTPGAVHIRKALQTATVLDDYLRIIDGAGNV